MEFVLLPLSLLKTRTLVLGLNFNLDGANSLAIVTVHEIKSNLTDSSQSVDGDASIHHHSSVEESKINAERSGSYLDFNSKSFQMNNHNQPALYRCIN